MTKDIWVISDTHFNHANILRFTDSKSGTRIRPEFDDVQEMNEIMIQRWNEVVRPGDKVYHLGDVVLGTDQEGWMKANWPRLMGQKRLIVGNHDNIKMLSSGGFFAKVEMWRMFTEFGLLLTHVPVHPSNLRVLVAEGDYVEGDVGTVQRQFLNVHGHIHQNPSPEGPYKNVSVEAIDYRPVNIEELRIV